MVPVDLVPTFHIGGKENSPQLQDNSHNVKAEGPLGRVENVLYKEFVNHRKLTAKSVALAMRYAPW